MSNRLTFTLLSILFIFSTEALFAQEGKTISLTLEKARNQAIEYNYTLRNAALDIEKARYKVKETVAIGLPQASATVNYNDNIALPVQLIPGDFFNQPGQDIEVQFGTRYSASLSGTINQLLFSGSYIVGLQASKAYLEQSKKSYVKNKIDVIKTASEAYFMVLASEEGIKVIDSTLAITRKLAEETKAIVANGFAEETDADQLELLISELEVSRNNALSQLEIAKSYLKFHLGLQSNDDVVLEESLTSLVENAEPEALFAKPFMPANNIDFQILKNQQDLALLQVKLEKSNYLPTLSAFLNYQTQAQRNQWDFFNNQGKWFSSSVIGVNMAIPIFSSGEKHARVKQAQFDVEKTRVAEEQLSTNLRLMYETNFNDLQTAMLTYENTVKNKQIAEKIFKRTGIKYREGMASSLDLLNTHNQYLTAQSQFINAALNLLKQDVSLETLLTDGNTDE